MRHSRRKHQTRQRLIPWAVLMLILFAASWFFAPRLAWLWVVVFILPIFTSWVTRVSHPWLVRRTAGGPGYSLETAMEIQRYLDIHYDRDGWSWEFSEIRFLDQDPATYEIRFTDCGKLGGILRLARDPSGRWVPGLVKDLSDEPSPFFGDPT